VNTSSWETATTATIFDEAYPMLQKLEEGYDVCMGSRIKGTIMPGSMPKLNRFIGNPVLTFMAGFFSGSTTSDFHCGMRGFRRDKVFGIGLVTTGMEWASEMVIKSKLNGLRMTEVAITLHKDGRDRPPHLRRWRDGCVIFVSCSCTHRLGYSSIQA